jgi:hypothetical protein
LTLNVGMLGFTLGLCLDDQIWAGCRLVFGKNF